MEGKVEYGWHEELARIGGVGGEQNENMKWRSEKWGSGEDQELHIYTSFFFFFLSEYLASRDTLLFVQLSSSEMQAGLYVLKPIGREKLVWSRGGHRN